MILSSSSYRQQTLSISFYVIFIVKATMSVAKDTHMINWTCGTYPYYLINIEAKCIEQIMKNSKAS